MAEKELKFCFYCGRLLHYRDEELDKCPYCGVELKYISNKILKK